MLQDLRFALRMFAKSPGATAAAVISLAIAIGPNCALFSVVDRLILKPPPVQGASQIYDMETWTNQGKWEGLSYPDLLDYRSQAGGIGEFIASSGHGAALTNSAGQREMILIELVGNNYFSIFGTRAALGRTLTESDARFQGQPPAVISYSLWQRQFGGAKDSIGKTLVLNRDSYSVVGVLPRGFREPGLNVVPTDVWMPLSVAFAREKGNRMDRAWKDLSIRVRLRDGMDQARAEAVLTTVAKRLASQYPDTNKGRTVMLEKAERAGPLGAIVLALAGLVILIACANITGILMAQGEARRQELAVRVAMGASRGRLVRQLIAESLLLSLLAAGLGLVLALWLIRIIPAMNPITIFRADFDFRVDSRVLIYTLSLALLTTLAAGLVPSLRASRPDLVPTLKGDAPPTGRRFRFRGALVIAQIAVCQFLLVSTGLLVRSYLEVQRMRPGFDPSRRVLAAYLASTSANHRLDFGRLADKLRAVPGVLRVTYTNGLPLSGVGDGLGKQVLVPGVSPEPAEIGYRTASADYFAILGTRILRGRDFDRQDTQGVAVVNENMARQFWGSADAAVGKVFRMDSTDCRVIGVVENGKYVWLQENPVPFMFVGVPPADGGEGTLLIETATAPTSLAPTVRKAIQDAEPEVIFLGLDSLRQHMRLALFPYRLGAGLVGTIAILGIFLAGVGLYGLVSYTVGRRAHEIGVRMAMGARPGDVLSLVLREALSRVAIGGVIGLGAALAAAQVMRSALYGVSPADPLGLAAAVAVVAAVALLAAYAPARRALRVDPMNALRDE